MIKSPIINQKEDLLSMLASVVSSNPTQEQVNVKCTSLGLIDEIPFELFEFPNGYYYSLSQIANLFFNGSRSLLLSNLAPEQLASCLCQDVSSKTIFIASGALKSVGEKTSNLNLVTLSELTTEDAANGTPKALHSFDRVERLESGEESTMSVTTMAYSLETKRNGLKRFTDSENKKDVKKRLSIDTRFTEKVDNSNSLLTSMKSSIKLKQQQQAIIDSRTRSAVLSGHPDNAPQQPFGNTSRSNLPKKLCRDSLSGIEQLSSPRAEFPNRELPRPRGYDTHGPHSAHPINSAKNSIPSPQSSHAHLTSQKAAFISSCEQIFDSHEATQLLQVQLREQIRKSTTLLYTLSSSGQMIEGLVRSHFREMQSHYGEKFGSALTDLNRRLVAIENRTFGSSQSEAFTSAGVLISAVPKENHEDILVSIADRIDGLEKTQNIAPEE